MKKLHERVNERMDALGLTQSELARLCGVKQSSIWSLLQPDGIQKPRFLYELANALQTSAEWLTEGKGFAGSGERFSEQRVPATNFSEAGRGPLPSPDVPIVGKPVAGKYGAALFIDRKKNAEIGRTPRHPAQEGVTTAFAIYAEDDSMFPRYEPGELVYIAGFTPPVKGQDCLVELNNGEAYLKKFLYRNEKTVVCVHYNPEKEWKCPLAEISQIHAVVGRR